MKSAASPLAALASALLLSGCLTTQPRETSLAPCPKPPASLLQRMEPLQPIPMSLSGPETPGTSTTPAAPGLTP